MVNFKNLTLLLTLSFVLTSSHAHAGGDKSRQNITINQLSEDLEQLTFKEAPFQFFFSSMQLRGYINLRIINDLLSPIEVTIHSGATQEPVSQHSLKIPSGHYVDTYIPENTSYVLKAKRTNIPHAKGFKVTTPAVNQCMTTHLSKWPLDNQKPTAVIVPTNVRRLFAEQDDENGINEDDNDAMFAD